MIRAENGRLDLRALDDHGDRPADVLPFAVNGILKTHVAIPLATTWRVATIRFPAIARRAEHGAAGDRALRVVLVDGHRDREGAPRFRRLRRGRERRRREHDLRQHLIGVEAVARVGREIAVDVGEVEIAGRR